MPGAVEQAHDATGQPGPATPAVDIEALSEEDLAYSPITVLARLIAGGQLTSRRLTEIYLDRIARLSPDLHCLVTVTDDLARRQADEADQLTAEGITRGPLHGIPYVVKDLFDTAGITTGWGAEPYRGRVPDSDAHVVERLREAGAVLLGKASLGALAYGDLWYGGMTRNPWNLNEGSSGSSAGSASAVAAGLCAFGIGTETLGSIVSPSDRCGTTGLRPTFGRVSRHGAMALCWTMDKVGPICRTVGDTGLVLEAINGHDPRDRSSIDAPFSAPRAAESSGSGPADITIGIIAGTFDQPTDNQPTDDQPTDDQPAEADDAAEEHASEVDVQALAAIRRLGYQVREVTLPDLPYDSLYALLLAEAAAAFEELTLSGADDQLAWQTDTGWPNQFRAARHLSAVDHVQLDRLRHAVMQALDELFSQVDIVIGPLAVGPMLTATNMTGHPCLHLRAGFRDQATRAPYHVDETWEDPAAGQLFTVPSGISLWAGLFDEARLLRVGQSLEAELTVWDRRPGHLA
ncbi:amidase [Euzebya tangerina]